MRFRKPLRSSHAIAPRFSVGYTTIVTRRRTQATNLVLQPDGTYKDLPVPGKMAVSYGFGGTSPLGMREAWEANLNQFNAGKRSFEAYVALLSEVISNMPRRSQ